MTITIHNDLIQGSEEWHAARCGLLTASEMKHIITPAKLEYAKNDKSRGHVYELAAQRITQYVEPSYISNDMLRGHDDEIRAKELYSDKYAPVTDAGFITRNIDGMILGYSPDGLVGDDGQIEIKSRCQKYQVQTIVEGEVPQEYILQIQTGLLVSGRAWCDFISYSGGLPMFPYRVMADKEMQAKILMAAIEFESKVNEVIEKYKVNSKALHMTERHIESEMFL